MGNEIIVANNVGMTACQYELIDQAKELLSHAKADNTLRAYKSDWNDFERWCSLQGVPSLPADEQTVTLYLTSLISAGMATSTVKRRISAINQAHRYTHVETATGSPLVRSILAGIRRTCGTAPRRQAAPLMLEDIQLICTHLPKTILGHRDKALILLGYAAALRESELVALTFEDVTFCNEGMKITIRRSKTDPNGTGSLIGVASGVSPVTCPVDAMRQWLQSSMITSGRVFRGLTRHGTFRSDHLNIGAVDEIIRRTAVCAGLDPSRFSGHSMRSGHITTAVRQGVPEHVVMKTSRHRSIQVFRGYIREADLWRDCSSSRLGL